MVPVVVIQCLVYNHEPYLRQCLDGFVMQQTDFPFVAIVHDDASTDHSADIIREYATKYPNIIHPIYETENQYSKPGAISRIMFETSKDAKYIAFCEGDDYWTDSIKLQRQVDFLESHHEYVATAENGLIQNTIINKEYPFNTDLSHDITQEEAIIKRRFPTAGVLCRREALDGFNETCQYHIDTIQWCWLISKGKFRYESIISSVYRKGAQGMTVYTEPFSFVKKMELWNLEILRVFNVSKTFIYTHLAKACLVTSRLAVRQLSPWSAVKCATYSCKYAIKSIKEQLCLSYRRS